jgi:hypothetical protein
MTRASRINFVRDGGKPSTIRFEEGGICQGRAMQPMGTRSWKFMRKLLLDLPRTGAAGFQPIHARRSTTPPVHTEAFQGAAASPHA